MELNLQRDGTSSAAVEQPTQATVIVTGTANLTTVSATGFHFYAWNEATDGTGSTTWFGVNTTSALRTAAGLTGATIQ